MTTVTPKNSALSQQVFDDIKKNNKSLSKKFVNIKDLEKN